MENKVNEDVVKLVSQITEKNGNASETLTKILKDKVLQRIRNFKEEE